MRKMMLIRIVGKYVWSVWKLWRGDWVLIKKPPPQNYFILIIFIYNFLFKIYGCYQVYIFFVLGSWGVGGGGGGGGGRPPPPPPRHSSFI